MKSFNPCLVLLSFTLSAPALRAAEAPDPAPPAGRPTKQELRDQLKPLTPEQRQAKMNEMRAKMGGASGPEFDKRRAEFEKLRLELQSLPPAERSARLQAFRQTNALGGLTNAGPRPITPSLSPEDTAAKRQQFRERIDSELTRLKTKKAEGTLTPEDTRRLERMNEWSKRLEGGPAGGPGALGAPRPTIDEQFPKPVEPTSPPKPTAPAPATK